MGLFDQIAESVKGAVGSAIAGEAPIADALENTGLGSLRGLVDRLSQGGLEEQVKSWLGSGANLPVTAEQIRSALGDSQIAQLARHLGVPVDAALELLARYLPAAIDKASPNGDIPGA